MEYGKDCLVCWEKEKKISIEHNEYFPALSSHFPFSKNRNKVSIVWIIELLIGFSRHLWDFFFFFLVKRKISWDFFCSCIFLTQRVVFNTRLLTMEDAYYEEQMGVFVDNMLLRVHMLGNGYVWQSLLDILLGFRKFCKEIFVFSKESRILLSLTLLLFCYLVLLAKLLSIRGTGGCSQMLILEDRFL